MGACKLQIMADTERGMVSVPTRGIYQLTISNIIHGQMTKSSARSPPFRYKDPHTHRLLQPIVYSPFLGIFLFSIARLPRRVPRQWMSELFGNLLSVWAVSVNDCHGQPVTATSQIRVRLILPARGNRELVIPLFFLSLVNSSTLDNNLCHWQKYPVLDLKSRISCKYHI